VPEEYRRKFEEPKRNVEQLLQDSSVFIKDMRIEPYTPLLRTNNFLQNTLSRLLGYSPTERKMIKLKCDEEGRLAVYEEPAGSLENRIYFFGLKTDLANGASHAFTSADVLLGNITWPFTVPEGKRLYIRHLFVYGTSPAKWAMQMYTPAGWLDVLVSYADSYDEVDLKMTMLSPLPAGTQLRCVVTNHGGTGDFSANAEGHLERE